MTYTLGLDLGTTASAVAINSGGDVSMFSIGHRNLVIPSVVYMGADGTVLVGESAERRATSDPAGIAREFKRRFGDPQPLILSGSPVAANDLTLELAKDLVGRATEQRGEAPEQIVVCHPANWGDYKVSLLADTLANSSLPPSSLITEPAAAAIHDATQEKLPAGSVVAVYDLGGGTFDVALLRKLDDGWEPIGKPGGIERLGGIDFDTAVLHHVVAALKIDLTSFESDDQTAQTAMFRLRDECQAAKHALSEDTATSIPVLLPGVNETVRLTRSEFEGVIGPAISRTLEVFDATVASSPIEMAEIDRVLMVGGSSQIPVVRQRVMNHTQRPVAVDRHPKHAIALGAAASIAMDASTPVADVPPTPPPAKARPAATPPLPDAGPTTADVPPVPPSPGPPPSPAPAQATPAPTPPTPTPPTPDVAAASADPVAEMYELPYMSEAPLPDFLNKPGSPGQPPAAATPPSPAPSPAPSHSPTPTPASNPATPPPAQSGAEPPPRLVRAEAAPTQIQHAAPAAHPPAVSGQQPAVSSQAEVRRGGGAGFWIAVVLIAALAGGATYWFLRDRPSDSSSTATTSVDQADEADASGAGSGDDSDDDADEGAIAETDDDSADGDATGGEDDTTPVFETSCAADQLPDPDVRYRVSDEPNDGFLNGRNVPGLTAVDGVTSTPVVTFVELVELDLTYTNCEVDEDGRVWWGVNSPDGLVWASTRFIEPIS